MSTDRKPQPLAPQSMDLNVRAVDVNALVKEHEDTIKQLFLAVHNFRRTRTAMQRLPRHMRRRAMSHNVKRMPRNWRSFASSATAQTKHLPKPPSRYWRRRRHFTWSPRVLRTHVWHAKRYSMCRPYGGMPVPDRCYQKVQRSSLRHAAEGACVVDHSYWKRVFVDDTPEVRAALAQLTAGQRILLGGGRLAGVVLRSTGANAAPFDCIGPALIRQIEKNGKNALEIALHPVSLPFLLPAWPKGLPALVEAPECGRTTLYGPQALSRVITALSIGLSSAENDHPFDDVLRGAVLMSGAEFHGIKARVKDGQNEVDFELDLLYRSSTPQIMDVICPPRVQKAVWLALVHNRCQPLGLRDECNVRAKFGLLNFPQDSADFVDVEFGFAESKELQEKHNRRPTNRRVKYSELASDSPFYFEWEKILANDDDDDDALIAVQLVPESKGVPKRFGFVYSEVEPASVNAVDTEEAEKSENPPPTGIFTKIVPLRRIFETEPPKKLKRGMKRRAKKKAAAAAMDVDPPSSVEFKIPQGTVIGRIVRGIQWTAVGGQNAGYAFASAKALKPILAAPRPVVYFRNPASKVYRKARISLLDTSRLY